MQNQVAPIPQGYDNITPYLIVNKGTEAIKFYKTVFGATVTVLISAPDGKVGHAELLIGNSRLMLADHCQNSKAPDSFTEWTQAMSIYLYIEDVDGVIQRALAGGATLLEPINDKFYGDRSGTIIDPFGHTWTIATHVEDVSPEELKKRAFAAGSTQVEVG
jgi:PhnB protein